MRRSQATYLLALSALLLFGLGAFTAWCVMSYAQSTAWIHMLLLIGSLLLLVAVGLWLYRFIGGYLFGVKALGDDARLMLNANPHHRVAEDWGTSHTRELSALLNQFADRFEQLTTERDQEIDQARSELEDERNMLVALMSELTEGVIICNVDGQILLYNEQARGLLGQGADAGQSPDGFVGLGRSIFDLVSREKLTFALDHLQAGGAATGDGVGDGNQLADLAEPRASSLVSVSDGQDARGPYFDVSTGFVTTVAQDRLARLRLSPCRNHDREFVGYIITLEDVSAEVARMDQVLTSYDLLDEAAAGSATGERAWRLEDMHVGDLLRALQTHVEQRLGLEAIIDRTAVATPNDGWLKIDSYAVLHAVHAALRDLHHNYSMTNAQFAADLVGDPNRVTLTLKFRAVFPQNGWAAWRNNAQQIDVRDATLTLNEVAVGHGGTLSFGMDCFGTDGDGVYGVYLHFQTSQPLVWATVPFVMGTRPEMYDFDLFANRVPAAQMQQRLTALSYTVFDTETTGLNISDSNPAARDTILSIGALRIVNGRLLRQEAFDQLVDPRCAISPESTAIHGITPDMVANQPPLARVLPAFHRYVGGAVLVAHNAAFDMRLLELNEGAAGVHFTNPVLDTLLLSTIVHPDLDNHALESIAARLGVRVVDRHTALGDALVTAEVFLRLLPLLAEMGITTLGDAIEVSKKSYLARIQY